MHTNQVNHETLSFSENNVFAKSVSEIKAYTPAQLHEGKEWYIDFYAYDPSMNKLRRKKIKLNRIKSITERRRYARNLIVEINTQLREGWNPFLQVNAENAFVEFDQAIDGWMNRMRRMRDEGVIRQATYDEYSSKAGTLKRHNASLKNPIRYAYQMNTAYVRDFLDYVYIHRKNTAKTYNNYLRVMNVIAKYLLEYGYISANPCSSLSAISKNKIQSKKREVVSNEHLISVREYLLSEDKGFLLACYLTYYCLVRPKELSLLKVGDFNLERQTILIRAEVAKNRKQQIVTLPGHIVRLMLDLQIFDSPAQYYLFGPSFLPAREGRSEKVYRDRWIKMRRALNLPESYQFYSLKDSGITDMLRRGIDPLSVRDQARHSSIQITDIYTPHDIKTSNPALRSMEGDF